jgi:predicted trehalose synthase
MAERRLMIVHGDYHLGQVLYHDGKYDVIDFEGEPMRYSSGNFVKSLPMKDVAGMIRSFDYSFAFSSIRQNKQFTDDARSKWLSEMKDNFLRSYRDSFDYDFDDDILEIFLIEKAIYELNYEINNRPDWVEIPLSFLDTRNI